MFIRLLKYVTFLFILSSYLPAQENETATPAKNNTSQVYRLDSSLKYQNLSNYLSILGDETGAYSFDQIQSDEFQSKFRTISEEGYNYKPETIVYWGRVIINNNRKNTDLFYLQQTEVRIEDIIFYKKVNGEYVKSQMGWSYPYSSREIDHQTYIYKIRPDKGENIYYFRFESMLGIQAKLTLWSPDDFLENAMNERMYQGLFFGILLVLAISNLSFWYFYKNTAHIFLSIFIVNFSLMFFNIKGLSLYYFWGDSSQVAIRELMILNFTTILSLILFAQKFLETKIYTPYTHRIINYQIITWCIVWCLLFIYGNYWLVFSIRILSVVIFITISAASILSLRAGKKEALYFILGISMFLVEAIIIAYKQVTTGASSASFNASIVEMLTILSFLFFTFSLNEQATKLRKENEDIKERELNLSVKHRQMMEQQNALLESQVEERTRKLASAKQLAEKANDAKSAFLANISHELRTPLHGILSFASIGKKKAVKKDVEKTIRHFDNIEKSGKRLLALISDLLNFSKIEAGVIDLEYTNISLSEILDNCILEVSQIFDQHHLIVQKDIQFTPDILNADAFKISQVITNMLSNAIKFSPSNSVIKVSINQESIEINDEIILCLCFSIMDSGVGIPENELEKVFGFFTQSSLHKNGAGGSGLGLAISRQIIEAHGGVMKAENNTNAGAKISFYLPLK